MIYFRLSIDFRVVYLVSRSDGETSGVCDSKCWTNEMHNAHYYFLYFNELLYYGSSLRSFKHANCKTESLLQIWKTKFSICWKGFKRLASNIRCVQFSSTITNWKWKMFGCSKFFVFLISLSNWCLNLGLWFNFDFSIA